MTRTLTKETLWSALTGVAVFVALSVALATPTLAAPITLEGTDQFEMTGTQNGRTYLVYLSVPETPAPAEGYPVIYVTDASQAFPIFIGPAGRYPAMLKETPAIIVGIGYPDGMQANKERAVDLTPPLTNTEAQQPGTGGADSFLKFITDDLKPEIENRYAVNKSKQTLIGHSFGGLFALYSLFTDSSEFQTYVISSPSIWFGDRHILTLEDQLKVAEGQTVRIFMTVGEYEETGTEKLLAARGNPEEIRARLKAFAMVTTASAMATRLETKATDFEFHIISGVAHMLAGRIAPLKAIPFIFD